MRRLLFFLLVTGTLFGGSCCMPQRSFGGMVWVPAGQLLVDAQPVDVGPFWMDEEPVSNGEFRAFLESTGYMSLERVQGPDKEPIIGIPWIAAKTYAEWAGKRLPTPEEWDWAAQAATDYGIDFLSVQLWEWCDANGQPARRAVGRPEPKASGFRCISR